MYLISKWFLMEIGFCRPRVVVYYWTTTSHNFAVTTHDHPRPDISLLPLLVIILPPPPTTAHNQPLFHRHHPWPTIIKSPLPTNNNGLATILLAIFLSPLLTQQDSKSSLNLFATTHRAPRNFLFQKVWTVFNRNLLIIVPMKTKIKRRCHRARVNVCED